jgi:hypothetical protein
MGEGGRVGYEQTILREIKSMDLAKKAIFEPNRTVFAPYLHIVDNDIM